MKYPRHAGGTRSGEPAAHDLSSLFSLPQNEVLFWWPSATGNRGRVLWAGATPGGRALFPWRVAAVHPKPTATSEVLLRPVREGRPDGSVAADREI